MDIAHDVAGGAAQIDRADNPLIDDHGHGDKDPDPRAPADRIDGRSGLIEFTLAQQGDDLALQCRSDLGHMGQRQADLAGAADHRALVVDQPVAREVAYLAALGHRRQPLPHGLVDWFKRFGHRHRLAARGRDPPSQAEARVDRAIGGPGPGQQTRRRRNAARHAVIQRPIGLGEALGQKRRLGQQRFLGLLDQLVGVELEQEDDAERQRQNQPQHRRDQEAQRGAPLPDDPVHRPARHSPSLKPTPCRVSIPSWQPASASLRRMLRIWLSSVRSATWIAGP